jgi:hypothetical protein
MNWEKATRLAYEIGRSQRAEARIDLFKKGVEYAHVRAEWQLLPPDRRLELDMHRTSLHDAFIEACDCMSRAMEEENEERSWRTELGDDRKEIGDFACYIHLILGLVAR